MKTSGAKQLAFSVIVGSLALGFPSSRATGGVQGEGAWIAGSFWGGVGSLKAKVQGFGRIEGPANFNLAFGPSPALAADEFGILLDDGSDQLSFGGTYTLLEPGKVEFHPSASSYEEAWCDLFYDAGVDDCAVDLVKMKMGAKVKSTSSGETLKVSCSNKSIVTLTILGETGAAKMGVSIKGEAVRY